jgi:hypothetical protein
MKKILTFFVIFILISFYSINNNAQIPQYYNSNTGPNNNAFPFMVDAGKSVNWLFAAGEINKPVALPSGNAITTVYFRLQTGGTRTYTNLQILMAQSSITTLNWTIFYPGPWDTVYNHVSATLTGLDNGWMKIDLDHPFPYDPTKSLIISVSQCAASNWGIIIWQSVSISVRRVWSVGGCPFSVYGGDAMICDFGVDVVPAPLPIKLLSFTGKCLNNSTLLNWSTASEINNDYFIIERSSDATNWQFVMKVPGHGSSNTILNYSAKDDKPLPGTTYYRLKQTDYNGKYDYFGPVSINCNNIPEEQNIAFFPNPFTSELMVDIHNISFTNAFIKIYDMVGKKVYELPLTGTDTNTQKLSLDLQNLKAGIYSIEFSSDSFSKTSRIVKDN